MNEQQLRDLIVHLRSLGRECEWSEFKYNNEHPEEIAEYISAISNSAAIVGVEFGYLVWGIHDESLDVHGTRFKMYPDIAIRELVGNAIIHQDFSIRGTGPMIEIFDRRIEITSPGKPLLDPIRFIDGPPQARNEAFAATARRLNMCEELGTGIDKVIHSVEIFQLPPPVFETPVDSTRSTLWAHKPLGEMTRDERVRACSSVPATCLLVCGDGRGDDQCDSA